MFNLIGDKAEEKKKQMEEKKEQILQHHKEMTLIDKGHLVIFMSVIYGYLLLLLLGMSGLYTIMFFMDDMHKFYKENIFITVIAIIVHVFTLLAMLFYKELTDKYFYKHLVFFFFIISTIYSYGLFSHWVSITLLINIFSFYTIVILINWLYCMTKRNHFVVFDGFLWNFGTLTLAFLVVGIIYYKYFIRIFGVYLVMLFYGYYINKSFVKLINNPDNVYDLEKNDYHIFAKMFLYSFFGFLEFLKELILVKFCQIPALIKEAYNFFFLFFKTLKGELCCFLFKLLCCF